MYAHVQSRQRALAERAAFQSYVHMYTDNLAAVVLRSVLQELLLAAAIIIVALIYILAAFSLGAIMARATSDGTPDTEQQASPAPLFNPNPPDI